MIAFAWMLVTAVGFMVSGALLCQFEWRLAGSSFVLTWLWMAFPKAVAWGFRSLGRIVPGKASPAKT